MGKAEMDQPLPLSFSGYEYIYGSNSLLSTVLHTSTLHEKINQNLHLLRQLDDRICGLEKKVDSFVETSGLVYILMGYYDGYGGHKKVRENKENKENRRKDIERAKRDRKKTGVGKEIEKERVSGSLRGRGAGTGKEKEFEMGMEIEKDMKNEKSAKHTRKAKKQERKQRKETKTQSERHREILTKSYFKGKYFLSLSKEEKYKIQKNVLVLKELKDILLKTSEEKMKLSMLTHDLINCHYRFYLFETQKLERQFGFDQRVTRQKVEKRVRKTTRTGTRVKVEVGGESNEEELLQLLQALEEREGRGRGNGEKVINVFTDKLKVLLKKEQERKGKGSKLSTNGQLDILGNLLQKEIKRERAKERGEKKEKEGKKARGRPRKDSGVKRKYDVIENEKKKEQEEQIDLMNEEELYQGTRRKTRKQTMNNLEEREKTTTTKKAAAIATNGRLKQEKEKKQQEKEKEKEKEKEEKQ